jgi:ankyrin repeat protein
VSAPELFAAIDAGDADRARELVDARPELAAARGEHGSSAVLRAAFAGHGDIVDLLLDANPALDVFDAAAVGRTRGLEELVEAEPALARSSLPDGQTPLHLAARFGQEDAARVLLERGADPAAVTADGRTPAELAVAAGHDDLATLLADL